MKSTAMWIVFGTVLVLGESVNAWGGLFNRFSPEMLANMGYSGGGVGGGGGGNGNSNAVPWYRVRIHLTFLIDIYLDLRYYK